MRSQCDTKWYNGRLTSNLSPSCDEKEANLMPNLTSLAGKNYSRKGGGTTCLVIPLVEKEGNCTQGTMN
jgi:hypothetical protein